MSTLTMVIADVSGTMTGTRIVVTGIGIEIEEEIGIESRKKEDNLVQVLASSIPVSGAALHLRLLNAGEKAAFLPAVRALTTAMVVVRFIWKA
jgi:hypothetical protein